MIGVIDYGMGNLRSVLNAFRFIDAEAGVLSKPADFENAKAIVLPGVGAFGDGMRNLRERGLVDALELHIRKKGKPFLGLCLGMQLLATTGTEHGTHQGLDWIPGVVDRLPNEAANVSVCVPHVGWNDVHFQKTDGLFAGLGPSKAFYFVHSYHMKTPNQSVASGICDHGIDFVASVEQDNLWATQFHPEKSHQAGLTLLRNFAKRVASW